MSTHKQAIVMANYLNMRKGKMVAQGAHASMLALINQGSLSADGTTLNIAMNEHVAPWLNAAFTKICLQADSEEQLKALCEKAKNLGIPFALITDSGKTEFNGVPTITCAAIGPADRTLVDQVTGNLKLF